MQLQAIADVAPVVTTATEAISETTPTHCGHHFSEVLSQNDELSPRNMKWKLSYMFMVTMATVAMLEMVYAAKAPIHGGYHLSEVWLERLNSFRENWS